MPSSGDREKERRVGKKAELDTEYRCNSQDRGAQTLGSWIESKAESSRTGGTITRQTLHRNAGRHGPLQEGRDITMRREGGLKEERAVHQRAAESVKAQVVAEGKGGQGVLIDLSKRGKKKD